ncbi:MAG TPA: GAF domain-containing protein, partial [Chloroflexota bacterium]
MLTLPLGGVHSAEPVPWRNRAGGMPVSPTHSVHALRALHRVALALTGTLDADSLAAIVAEHTRRLVRAGAVAIYWWDPEGAVLDRVADTDARALARPSIGLGSGAVGQAFASRQPVIVPDYQSWARAVPQVAALGVVSVLAVPVMAKGDPVGVISARSYRPRRWAARHIELLRLFAG